MKKLVLENESLIEKFDLNYYLKEKHYSIAAAISALETANEIQKSYFKEENDLDVGDNILRLYALFQGLFVSVDSLYSLAYALTKTKNFININLNTKLRELKYIRNDVVGHPANRILDSNDLAYCILDKNSINKNSFEYMIYSEEEVINKKVDINELVKAYYIECNNYLKAIFNRAVIEQNKNEFYKIAKKCLESFQNGGDYLEQVNHLKSEYMKLYPNANVSLHRVLWRIELIELLRDFSSNDQDIKELIEYSIGLELIKIIELFNESKEKISLIKRAPNIVSSVYRFLKKNPKMERLSTKINDIGNPLFKSSIEEIIRFTNIHNVKKPYKYFTFINDLYKANDDSMVYALTLILREYDKNR